MSLDAHTFTDAIKQACTPRETCKECMDEFTNVHERLSIAETGQCIDCNSLYLNPDACNGCGSDHDPENCIYYGPGGLLRDEDYPLGGSIEAYDVEIEKELTD